MTADNRQEGESPDLGRLIDRLVDGGLSGADRRALLLRLEAEPDGEGWRLCALTFLEDREWREAIGDRTDRQHSSPPAPSPATPGRRSFHWIGIAASLSCAFLLGWASKSTAPATPERSRLMAVNAPASSSVADPHTKTDENLGVEDWRTLDGRSPAPTIGQGGDYWRPSPSSTVPAPESPWAWSDPPIPGDVPELPRTVLEDWRRQGYEVESMPKVLSVGRDIALPVNEVRVRYIGDRTY